MTAKTSNGAKGPSANPYVFIVGCPRSGTTLLKRMVDAHPLLKITRETHWIPRYYEKRTGLDRRGRVTPELVEALLGYHKFHNLGISREELEGLLASSGDPPTYAELVSGIFELCGRHEDKPLAGDKTPGYVRHVPLLHSLFPRARFLHLIRDGRDVCLSVLNWDRAWRTAGRFATWEKDRVSTAALWWEWHVRLGLEGGREIGPDLYHEIRYESLVRDPAAVCRSLCSFLDLPFDDSMLTFHEGRTKRGPGLSAKGSWLPITPGLRDWRTQMAAQDVERFEAAAGELLGELGYSRRFPNPRAERLRHASSLRQVFSEDARSRSRALPASW